MRKELKDWQIAVIVFAIVILVGCFLSAQPRPVPYEQKVFSETEVEDLQAAVDTLKENLTEKENDVKRLTVKYAYDKTFFGFETYYVVVQAENGSLLRIKVKEPIYSKGDSILVEEIQDFWGIIKYEEVIEIKIIDRLIL